MSKKKQTEKQRLQAQVQEYSDKQRLQAQVQEYSDTIGHLIVENDRLKKLLQVKETAAGLLKQLTEVAYLLDQVAAVWEAEEKE